MHIILQKKTTEQKKKEQDEVNQLFKPVIAQKVSAGLYACTSEGSQKISWNVQSLGLL